jgi:hypothetical protein
MVPEPTTEATYLGRNVTCFTEGDKVSDVVIDSQRVVDRASLLRVLSFAAIYRPADKKSLKNQCYKFEAQRMMRSSLVVRASDCQCTSYNGPGFDPSIRRHSGI